ncbi:MAG: PhzF family phenazine biosynthesis protein [bacterium]|nr:MAG: PhzF family phenazine biosynthesis protein [bacterium]
MIKQVDAFTTKPFCGNPAGVITEADGLTVEEMQKVAASMNLSETAFVTMPESLDTSFRIRYFTPSEEVDLSGHATIASCYALLEDERIPLKQGMSTIVIETNIGHVQVDIHFNANIPQSFGESDGESGVLLKIDRSNVGVLEKILMHQSIMGHRPSGVPTGTIAGILGINESEILGTGLPLEVISTGLDQLMVPIEHKETILNMHPDLIKLGLLNKKFGIHTNHIFSLDTFDEDCVSYARHYAPALGMWEDPATGTASAGLGTYLLRHGVITYGSMIMQQGKETSNLARIMVEVDLSGEDLNRVQIGGLATTSFTRTLNIESNEVVIN